MAGYARCYVRPRNLEEATLLNAPIVEEVRKNGQEFSARFNNDLAAICKALREKERLSGRRVVNRAPNRIVPKSTG